MQKHTRAMALGAALFITAAAPAAVFAQAGEPAVGMAIGAELSGEVMVVNTETRLMTIKDADGKYHVLHVPPEVTRLDKIKIGDKVEISQISTALIELVPAAAAGPIASESSTEVDRTPGSKPGGTITDTLTVYGKIVGLDKKAGSVTIEGPDGKETYEVSDPAMLDGVKVGDGVVARFRNVVIGEVK
jgi:hypothetical protein